jgi:FAD/FMN-containing dehydrogenase
LQWSDVDAELAKYGFSTVGGTVDHTGIGGLSLGGGYGYLMGQHGMVVDNILEVELVLADGTVVTASESQNEDLFWAARGAGFKFGKYESLI